MSFPRKIFFSRYFPILISVALIAAVLFIFFIRRPANNQIVDKTPSSTQPADNSAGQTKLFVHPTLGFSFEYPANFTVGQFQDNNGQTVLVQSPPLFSKEGEGGSSSLQIYVQPFNEPGPITAARIKKDLPQQLISNPQNISVGGQPALIFDSQEDGIGPTFEAWFVYSGQLYSLTAPASSSDLLQSLLSSWKFDQ